MVAGEVFVLEGPEARHAVTVKRLAPGEPVDIVDGAGTRMSGKVLAASPSGLDVECGSVAVEQQPDTRLVLVQALAKGDRDELAIETATELGIDAVIPWQSERSIVRGKATGPRKPTQNGSPWSRQPPSRHAVLGSPRCGPPSTPLR